MRALGPVNEENKIYATTASNNFKKILFVNNILRKVGDFLQLFSLL